MRPTTAITVLGLTVLALVLANLFVSPGATRSAVGTVCEDGD